MNFPLLRNFRELAASALSAARNLRQADNLREATAFTVLARQYNHQSLRSGQ